MYFEVNGKQVFASTGGKAFDNKKPVVIFLHGSALDHTFWGLHSRFFAFRNYAVLVPDLPGHTHSEGPALTSIEAIADWLNDIVGVLDIDSASINRFGVTDQEGVEKLCATFCELQSTRDQFI